MRYRSHPRHTLARRQWLIAILGAALSATTPARLLAQVYPSHTDDAAPVPKGVLRVKVTTVWTRFDERFTSSGRRPLSDDIATDSLGARQFPRLTPVEQGLQALTNDPLTRLSFGRLAARSDVRIVTTPFAFEYGVSRRLSIGVVVPVVQTRRNIQLRMNQDSLGRLDSTGNVGWIPERLRQNAATVNQQVFAGFQNAADSLTKLLANCPANPNAAGCATVLANTADASSTRLAVQQFAAAVKAALGTDSASAYVAPRLNSVLATRIQDQRTLLNAKVQKYLGAGAGAATDVFSTASPFAYVDLQGRNGAQGLLQSPLGGGFDSIQTTNTLRLNGFTIGAQYLLLDRFQLDTLPIKGVQTRILVGGAFRYQPTFIDSTRKFGLVSDGDGSGIEVRSAMDVISGRLGATIAGRFVKSLPRTMDGPVLGDPDAFYLSPAFGSVTSTAGTVIGVDVTPRFLFGDWFALDGHYGYERRGATTYDVGASTETCAFCAPFSPNTSARSSQFVGVGLRYSTADAYLRGLAKTPIEVSFTHLEAISGDPGVPKIRRDQIQLRLYLNVRTGK
ncbi:MAG: hypothetical protein ABIT20_00130 [Gemmatimonadaceae bacterium]